MLSKNDKLRQLIGEQAAEWYATQLEGPLTSRQAAELVRWLQTSPLHVAEYLAIAQLERGLAEVARADATPLDELLAATGAQVQPLLPDVDGYPSMDVDGLAGRPRRYPATGRRGWGTGWAAALAAVLVVVAAVAFIGWSWFGSGSTQETFVTGRGQQREAYLPDHTRLRLDADSRVVVRFSRERREVVVQRGQAWFEVAADAARPFGVRAGPLAIHDIGTTFDVYRQAAGTTVTVIEGHVEVSDAGAASGGAVGAAGALASLGPGEQVRVGADGRVLAEGAADLWQALAWTHGRINFEDMPIGEVAREFNRYNAVELRVTDPAIGAIRITGTFESHGVASFVRFLEGLPGVAVSTRGQRITVAAARPRR